MLLEELLPEVNLSCESKGIIYAGDGEEFMWLKTLAAFANTQGGCLYVGVEDRSHKVIAFDPWRAGRLPRRMACVCVERKRQVCRKRM